MVTYIHSPDQTWQRFVTLRPQGLWLPKFTSQGMLTQTSKLLILMCVPWSSEKISLWLKILFNRMDSIFLSYQKRGWIPRFPTPLFTHQDIQYLDKVVVLTKRVVDFSFIREILWKWCTSKAFLQWPTMAFSNYGLKYKRDLVNRFY